MSQTSEVRFRDLAGAHDRQWAAIEAGLTRRQPNILLGGSGYGGKSYALRMISVFGLMYLAQSGVREPLWMLGSGTLPSLRDRHFQKLTEEWGDYGELVLEHKTFGCAFLMEIPTTGGIRRGAILLRSSENLAGKRGSEVDGGAFDELTEAVEADYGAFKYLVRRQNPANWNPVFSASNPDGRGFAWVKALWRPHLMPGDRPNWWSCPEPWPADSGRMDDPADYIYVPFLPDDNPTFDEARFWASVAGLPPHIQKARRYGDWSAPEGAYFSQYAEDVHLFSLADLRNGIPAHWPRTISADWGFASPFCALWHAWDEQGNPWTYRELYAPGLGSEDQIKAIRAETSSTEQIVGFTGDPAMFSRPADHKARHGESVAETWQKGLEGDSRFLCGFTRGPTGAKEFKLSTLHRLLNRDNDYPDWRIERKCVKLRMELESAQTDRKGGEGLDAKAVDHAIDAAVYGLHGAHWKAPRQVSLMEQVQESVAQATEMRRLQAVNDLMRRRR